MLAGTLCLIYRYRPGTVLSVLKNVIELKHLVFGVFFCLFFMDVLGNNFFT